MKEWNLQNKEAENRRMEDRKKGGGYTGRADGSPTGKRARFVAVCGMMTALAFLFSYVETLIPVNLGVPGVKLGLANLVTIISLYLLGVPAAAVITLVRVILTGITFGNLSMMLYSLAGAALSLLLMVFFKKKDWFGTVGISILGGAGHNVGQLLVAAAVVETSAVFYYLPVLLVAGTVAGAIIGIVGGMMIKRLSWLIR